MVDNALNCAYYSIVYSCRFIMAIQNGINSVILLEKRISSCNKYFGPLPTKKEKNIVCLEFLFVDLYLKLISKH